MKVGFSGQPLQEYLFFNCISLRKSVWIKMAIFILIIPLGELNKIKSKKSLCTEGYLVPKYLGNVT